MITLIVQFSDNHNSMILYFNDYCDYCHVKAEYKLTLDIEGAIGRETTRGYTLILCYTDRVERFPSNYKTLCTIVRLEGDLEVACACGFAFPGIFTRG